jgi:hypothetical protein
MDGGGASGGGNDRGGVAEPNHCSDTGLYAPLQISKPSGKHAFACTAEAMKETRADDDLSAVPIKAKTISSAAHAAMARP